MRTRNLIAILVLMGSVTASAEGAQTKIIDQGQFTKEVQSRLPLNGEFDADLSTGGDCQFTLRTEGDHVIAVISSQDHDLVKFEVRADEKIHYVYYPLSDASHIVMTKKSGAKLEFFAAEDMFEYWSINDGETKLTCRIDE